MSIYSKRTVTITVFFAGLTALMMILSHAPQRAVNTAHENAGRSHSMANTNAGGGGNNDNSTAIEQTGSTPPAVLRWDAENIAHWMRLLGAPLPVWRYTSFTNGLLLTALEHNVPVVSNVSQFLATLYFMPFTNDTWQSQAMTFIRYSTNESLAKALLDIFTNDYGRQYTWPEEGRTYVKSGCLDDALRQIGTPEVIEALNRAWVAVAQEESLHNPPRETISPDRYPREAREWLFTHWSPGVREAMVSRWLKSERPETAQVLSLYIKKLEGTAVEDPYWGPTNGWARDPFGRLLAARAYEKQAWIAEIKDKTEHYARQYRRWLKDKQRMPLHSGLYQDDGWDMYRRMSDEERRQRWGRQYGSSMHTKQLYDNE